MMLWLYCEECGWSGTHDELVAATDDDDDNEFIHCPECGGTDFEEEEEEKHNEDYTR